MAEFVPVFAEFVEVETDISNWTEPQRRFAEVKSKTERTSDEKASRASRACETRPKCSIESEEKKNKIIT